MVAMVLAEACAPSTKEKVFVKTQHDDDVPFAAYRDYRWVPDDKSWTYPLFLRYPEIPGIIQSAVRNELAAKGFHEMDRGEVDFLVAVSVSMQDVTVVSTHRYRGWSHGYNRTRMSNYRTVSRLDKLPEGTLIMEIIDAPSERVVWQSRAAGVVHQRDAIEAIINDAVGQMLAKFPPRADR